jgi:hypothetical protein
MPAFSERPVRDGRFGSKGTLCHQWLLYFCRPVHASGANLRSWRRLAPADLATRQAQVSRDKARPVLGDPDLVQMGSCAGPRNQQFNGSQRCEPFLFRACV